MTTYRRNTGDGLLALFRDLTRGRRFNRGAAWGLMIIGALLAFEIFNFSTTQFALADVLGGLTFAGMRWASILAASTLPASPVSLPPSRVPTNPRRYITSSARGSSPRPSTPCLPGGASRWPSSPTSASQAAP
jgi:hypothetical protein